MTFNVALVPNVVIVVSVFGVPCNITHAPTIAIGLVVAHGVAIVFNCTWQSNIHAYFALPLPLPCLDLDSTKLWDYWSMSIARNCNKQTHNKKNFQHNNGVTQSIISLTS